MGVLGTALGKHLSVINGLYSVELPQQLSRELVALVETCNSEAQSGTRAILVSDDFLPATGVATTQWREILKWRTDDDRIFAWERGRREPDSSFQSAVQSFISRRFPGEGGGECSLEDFTRLCIHEVALRKRLEPASSTVNAFNETAYWVAGVLRHSFELVGNQPDRHWSDDFLVHWAGILDQFDETLSQFETPIDPRHAWEIVRLSGLPLPSLAKGGPNPFTLKPKLVEEKQWRGIAEQWQRVYDTYIALPGELGILLTALDRLADPADQVCSWRGLPWERVRGVTPTEAAPFAAGRVFSAPESPTLLTLTVAEYTVPSTWWGVDTDALAKADDAIKRATEFRPVASAVITDVGPAYLVCTREGDLTRTLAKTRWTARVTLPQLQFRYRGPWREVLVGHVPPVTANEGDVWVDPSAVQLRVSGASVSLVNISVSAVSGALEIKADAAIDYRATIDTSGLVRGTWGSSRVLKSKLRVSDWLAGGWGTAREVEASFPVIIPSPFAPTIIPARPGEKPSVSPAQSEAFWTLLEEPAEWKPEATPDISLGREGLYNVVVYDGRVAPLTTAFEVPAIPEVDGDPLAPSDSHDGMFEAERHLVSESTIDLAGSGGIHEAAVFRTPVEAPSNSSGLVAALRGDTAEMLNPPNEARASLLGQYESSVASALEFCPAEVKPQSLLQFIIAAPGTRSEWPRHAGDPQPHFLVQPLAFTTLPGVGSGPSTKLVDTTEWEEFTSALQKLRITWNLTPNQGYGWLSGLDPSSLSMDDVQAYVKAHTGLVRAAKALSAQDAFWASYPFSIFVVDGAPDAPTAGELLAILLSPLHPVRLAWSYAVAFSARKAKEVRELLGLAEGWNFPYTGSTLNPAGQQLDLIAVPLDAGEDEIFAGWSALAALNTSGLVRLPAEAGGYPLPWGGLTGLNERIVDRALREYLAVHPHLTSLEVDLRSTHPFPRSNDIDAAVIQFLGAATTSTGGQIGGAVRVWDSSHRQGSPPSRERLLALRSDAAIQSFEWRPYTPSSLAKAADIAFIENASVNVMIAPGSTDGVIPPLPIRRFIPTEIQGNRILHNYSASPSDDFLGVSELLGEIERRNSAGATALSGTLHEASLGIGGGARWEILGTFNIDPGTLANIANAASRAESTRLLWEWRPSWLSTGSNKQVPLSRRPYYIVARAPGALLKALEARQGISRSRAVEMLSQLSQRGIGLASLTARGVAQEQGAAGFYYAIRAVFPTTVVQPPLAAESPLVSGLIPLDAVYAVLEGITGAKMSKRADLLALQLRERDGVLDVFVVAIEIKHYAATPLTHQLPPGWSNAREQLGETVAALQRIGAALNDKNAFAASTRRVALATLIDLALDLAPVTRNAVSRSGAIAAVLRGNIRIGVGAPLLLWFAPGAFDLSGMVCIENPFGAATASDKPIYELYIDPRRVPGMWWEDAPASDDDRLVRSKIDSALERAFADCELAPSFQRGLEDPITAPEPTSPDPQQAANSLETSAGPFPELRASDVEPDESTRSNGNLRHMEVNPHPSSAEEPGESAIPGTGAGDDHKIPVVSAGDGDLAQLPLGRVDSGSTGSDLPSPSTTPGDGGPATSSRSGIEPAKRIVPAIVIGATERSRRWNVIGRLHGTGEPVALDLDHPKAIGVFGYMGSGKSYLLGALIEGAVEQLGNVNQLGVPLAAVVFNYRRNASDRFELNSFREPNGVSSEVERLKAEYATDPAGLADIHVLCLPGEAARRRHNEYHGLGVSELFFNPRSLSVEDWELLMGEPGNDAVFARTIRQLLRTLSRDGDVSLDRLREHIDERLTGQSRSAAGLRLDSVEEFISPTAGVDFGELLRPGRILVVDLRQELFNKEDALRLFLVCANQISRVQGQFNKLLVFDEAHEYMGDAFSEKIESRIRLMRHEGTTYVFATQDVGSIPLDVRRFITTRFVFDLGTRQNIDDLIRFAPEFRDAKVTGLRPGECLVQTTQSTGDIFTRPRGVSIRPRVSGHGGRSRIFAGDAEPPS